MNDLPPIESVWSAVDSARAVMISTLIEREANDFLEELVGVMPFDAGWIVARDPEDRTYEPVAMSGDARVLVPYFDSPTADREVQLVGLDGPGPAILSDELPVPIEEIEGWSEYLWPAGFRKGAATGLFAPDGRHLGMVVVCSESAHDLGPPERDRLGALAPALARRFDRLAVLRTLVHSDTIAAAVVTRSGQTLPIPGVATHPLLAAGSAVMTAVAFGLAHVGDRVTFLCPSGEEDHPGPYRVSALDVTWDAHDHLAGLVVLTQPASTVGLDVFDLKLLGLLGTGRPVEHAAGVLGIDEDTVRTHVERVSAVLGCAPRPEVVAARAVAIGLLIPPPMWLTP